MTITIDLMKPLFFAFTIWLAATERVSWWVVLLFALYTFKFGLSIPVPWRR